MSKQREFLIALISGDIEKVNVLKSELKEVTKPVKRITAFERNGNIHADSKSFTETEFREYLAEQRNLFRLKVTTFRTRKRKRPTSH